MEKPGFSPTELGVQRASCSLVLPVVYLNSSRKRVWVWNQPPHNLRSLVAIAACPYRMCVHVFLCIGNLVKSNILKEQILIHATNKVLKSQKLKVNSYNYISFLVFKRE